jgi:hypothetical protein
VSALWSTLIVTRLWRRLWNRDSAAELEVIPEHERPLGRMFADARSDEYLALRSLDEARTTRDATVIMQGDDGGSIYLTCPIEHVRCDEQTLRRLLLDLDALVWKDSTLAGLFFELAPVGAGVAGGMGGGMVVDGLWLHPELEALGVRESVEAVIVGRRRRIR